jgi:hypothetical protein
VERPTPEVPSRPFLERLTDITEIDWVRIKDGLASLPSKTRTTLPESPGSALTTFFTSICGISFSKAQSKRETQGLLELFRFKYSANTGSVAFEELIAELRSVSPAFERDWRVARTESPVDHEPTALHLPPFRRALMAQIARLSFADHPADTLFVLTPQDAYADGEFRTLKTYVTGSARRRIWTRVWRWHGHSRNTPPPTTCERNADRPKRREFQ